jgi:hypothetical protein
MTTPEQTPEIELEAQELSDENLDEVSGGKLANLAGVNSELEADATFLAGSAFSTTTKLK